MRYITRIEKHVTHTNETRHTYLGHDTHTRTHTYREAEIKLHPLQQREADLAEELNRQKEKERLRKEYIEEVKKKNTYLWKKKKHAHRTHHMNLL